jgi:hypothetical protein
MSINSPLPEVDYIIIGGDLAGCVLALPKFYKQSTQLNLMPLKLR